MAEKKALAVPEIQLDEKAKVKYLTANVYFGVGNAELLKRMQALEKRFPSVTISGLMVTAAAACIETFEKEIPNKRQFKLNGCLITV
jgi:hypothetical protein